MLDKSQFCSVLDQCFTEDDMRELALGLIKDARSKNVRVRLAARADLFNRLYGRPTSDPIVPPRDCQSELMKLSDQELIDLFQKQIAQQPWKPKSL